MGDTLFTIKNAFNSLASATIVADIAAILLLVCVMIYTSAYRRRGKPEDRLFFAMILLNMASAFFDVIDDCFDGLYPAGQKYSALLMASHSFFIICYTLTCYLFVKYLYTAYMKNDMHVLLSLPLILLTILLIINFFAGELFFIDASGKYSYGKLWIAIYLAAYFYAAAAIVLLWRIKRPLAGFALVMIAISIVIQGALYRISSTPFMLSIVLIFAHICLMNSAFYEEMIRSGDLTGSARTGSCPSARLAEQVGAEEEEA